MRSTPSSTAAAARRSAQALVKNAGRVMDLFREWDIDGDGEISRKEFRSSMKRLGLEVPAKDIDALFDSWDPDGGGTLDFKELQKVLRGGGGGTSTLSAAGKKVAAGGDGKAKPNVADIAKSAKDAKAKAK